MLRRITAFLLLPLYTRFLTPSDYGIKELVAITTDAVSILIATAISSAIFRFYFDYDEIKDRNEVISCGLISLGVVGLCFVILLSLVTETLAKYILDSPDLYYFFNIAFISMWFQSLNEVGYNYLRASNMSVKFIVLSLLTLLLSICFNIYFIVIAKIGVLGILISTLISSIIICIILVFPLIYKIGLHFSSSKLKEMIKFGLPLVLSQFSSFFVNISDRFFIKGYFSIADAGLYSLGYRFGILPNRFVATPFNLVWYPRRFELHKQKNSEIMFGKIFTYFLLLMAFGGLGVSILTKDVIIFMADEAFWSAYRIVPIIALASIISSFYFHFNIGILIQKKTKYLAYINTTTGIGILILNFLLIKSYGVYGAAFATLIAFVYKVALTYYFGSKCYKIYFEFLRIGKILIAAAFIYILTLFINFDSIFVSLVIKTCFIFTFPIILLIFCFYTKEEKQKVIDLINSKFPSLKMKSRRFIY